MVLMKPIPRTNDELRVEYAPLRTCIAMMGLGLFMSIARNLVYDFPFQPIRAGLAPFFALSLLGIVYAIGVLGWLRIRKFYVR